MWPVRRAQVETSCSLSPSWPGFMIFTMGLSVHNGIAAGAGWFGTYTAGDFVELPRPDRRRGTIPRMPDIASTAGCCPNSE